MQIRTVLQLTHSLYLLRWQQIIIIIRSNFAAFFLSLSSGQVASLPAAKSVGVAARRRSEIIQGGILILGRGFGDLLETFRNFIIPSLDRSYCNNFS